ncbi:MAG: ABC transporter permease [Kiritimatiellae bacterium]|nr:ABC transporter permease [Kiritimatiellia bacterium]
MPFSLFLALKYLKPKRSVTSVITCVSVLGVLLGVAAVIIVRAVMTGFGDLWEQKILDFKPHVTLSASSGMGNVIRDEEKLVEKLAAIPGVTSAMPEIDTRIMLEYRGRVSAPVVLGVDPDRFQNAYRIGAPRAGDYDLECDSIVLGVDLARQLGCWVGDMVTVYSPKTLASRDEIYLPLKWKVTGIFSSGQRDYDSGFSVCSLASARELMGLDHGVFAIHLRTAEPSNAPVFDKLVEQIRDLAPKCRVVTWRQADRELFNALAVEKNMTAFLLMLITIVALFCVMNTLLVLTVQKTSEIGLLKALGFTKAKIMGAFVVHGLVQVTTGTLLGLATAYAVLRNLQNIVDQLARFGVQVFPKSVYGLDSIPYRLVAADVVWVVAIVYFFGLLAALVPAFLAASKNPVEALNK